MFKLLEVVGADEEAIKSQATDHAEREKRQMLAVLTIGLIGGLVEGFNCITIKVIIGVILTCLIICVLNHCQQNRKVAEPKN